MAKKRIDIMLTDLGLAKTRHKAQAMLMAGLVSVNNKAVTKSGALIEEGSSISLKDQLPYVSRGGLKLVHAIRQFGIKTTDLTALDIGASTGGFTDCLLKHGAKKVYSVDVGYGQMDFDLRRDERVTLIERTNARYPFPLPEQVDIATIDISFISFRKVLMSVTEKLKPSGNLIILIKPQFEADKADVGKGGVVRDPKIHAKIIGRSINWLIENEFRLLSVTPSPILGPAGNREFFFHVKSR